MVARWERVVREGTSHAIIKWGKLLLEGCYLTQVRPKQGLWKLGRVSVWILDLFVGAAKFHRHWQRLAIHGKSPQRLSKETGIAVAARKSAGLQTGFGSSAAFAGRSQKHCLKPGWYTSPFCEEGQQSFFVRFVRNLGQLTLRDNYECRARRLWSSGKSPYPLQNILQYCRAANDAQLQIRVSPPLLP